MHVYVCIEATQLKLPGQARVSLHLLKAGEGEAQQTTGRQGEDEQTTNMEDGEHNLHDFLFAMEGTQKYPDAPPRTR